MDRLALDFGETIESLRNEVESMWDEIQISFDTIDREIDQTISQYKPTGYYCNNNTNISNNLTAFDIDTTQILYESDNPDDINDINKHNINNNIKRYSNNTNPIRMSAINSITSSISSANSAQSPSPNPNTNTNMTREYQAHRISAYSTPIHTHIMNSYPYTPVKRGSLKNNDSNHSEISLYSTDNRLSDDDTINTNIKYSNRLSGRLSGTHELLSDLNDFNRNDTVHTPPVPGLDPNQKSFRIELANPNDSPTNDNQIEMNHMDDIHIDDSDGVIDINDNDTNYPQIDRMQLINRISIDLETNAHVFQHRNSHHERNNTVANNNSDHEIDLNTIKQLQADNGSESSNENSGHSSLDYLFKDNEKNIHSSNESDDEIILTHRHSKQRLSIPKGLSNIDITAQLADHSDDSSSSSSSSSEYSDEQNEQDDKYPLALPMIPQTSSVDHAATQTPQEVSDKHRKKKSISQLALQDLALDRKVNINHKNSNKMSNTVMMKERPLTPLAMITQIGMVDMPDISDISAGNFSNINSKSVPSPPDINGRKDSNSNNILNTTKITPTVVNSDDYINIFNSDRGSSSNVSDIFKFDTNGLDNNNNITDINYENNHNLQSGINREDSNYDLMINKEIDIIVNETNLYHENDINMENKRRNSKKVMISPEVKNSNTKLSGNLSYSFDDINNTKTPIINEEHVEMHMDSYMNIQFENIEETLLIIKKNGEEYINDICDRLANEDLFYINEFIEIDQTNEEFYKLKKFVNKYNGNDNIKSVMQLFNELLLNDSIVIIPLYRINGIIFLYECIIKYQSITKEKEIEIDKQQKTYIHMKKPTDELPDIDNSHFHDYNEYPSDDDKNIQKIDENLRELFSIQNVYAPKNKNEYNIIKSVLCPNTKYYNYNINNIIRNKKCIECMKCIAIIKPNAIINGYESLIRATLIGNGFIIPKYKTIKYSKNEIRNIYNEGLGMDGYKYYIENNVNMNEIYEYLCSGIIIIMIVEKYIGINPMDNDECLNINDCFNKLNQLIGFVDPQIDRINDENTQSIRGCFGEDYIKNIMDITTNIKDYRDNVQLFFDSHQQ